MKTSKPTVINKIGQDWYILNDILEEVKNLNLEEKWEETNSIITIWKDTNEVVYIPCRDWHIFCHNNGV
jgi:hypothetical protein